MNMRLNLMRMLSAVILSAHLFVSCIMPAHIHFLWETGDASCISQASVENHHSIASSCSLCLIQSHWTGNVDVGFRSTVFLPSGCSSVSSVPDVVFVDGIPSVSRGPPSPIAS